MISKKTIFLLFLLGGLFLFISCKKEILSGNDPNFTIVKNDNKDYKKFNRKVEVFGLYLYATKKVEDRKLLHAANVLAQYLDNDEDGTVDNQLVLDVMLTEQIAMALVNGKTKLPEKSQDLWNKEIIPEWHTNGHTGQFDATLEEVLHIITHVGYANAYPAIFGETTGTSLANAMDIARGGQFATIPSSYPSGAWYSYTDNTCEYNCMVTEYMYWSLTSILGAQENRLSEIQEEWSLNTNTMVQTKDTSIYNLLTDIQYKFPTILPDGTYKH